ncbi:MAG: cysteine--tRNA ligase [Candidatus Dasytiphilus stammeri]
MLKIYNSLSHKKEAFQPINLNEIGMYVCGVTVYDLCHVGHARTFIIFDIIVRYLRYCGYKVKYIRNITDIDDKIIQRAIGNKESIDQLTNRMILKMHTDFSALNILSPDIEPRATYHIAEMINFIQNLLIQKFAYISSYGDIFFDINSYPSYGHLSRQNINQLKFKQSTTIKKHNPMDFILWKKSTDNQMGWNSPWGKGRPGWHIECSAMNNKYLGKKFDIHGGGIDLIFPHHENEMAQSTCINKNTFVNYWIHSGMVFIEDEKMSKSSTKVITIREILKYHNSETLRYFMIASHYRSPLIYSDIGIKQAHVALTRLYKALSVVEYSQEEESLFEIDDFERKFQSAMDDDFNTPKAFAVLFDLAREIDFFKKKHMLNLVKKLSLRLRKLAGILGLLQQDPNNFLQFNNQSDKVDIDLIKKLIIERNNYRKNKNWKKADLVRNQLKSIGIIIEDGPNGTSWRYNTSYEN